MREDGSRPATALIFAVCLATTIFEGFDIQAMGVAAPAIVREFGLRSDQTGILFSASLSGLFFGSAISVRLAARFRPMHILTGSVLTFGLATLLTLLAWDIRSLVGIRFLTGIGLGGAMPNLIVTVTNATSGKWQRSITTLLWGGTPIGGMLVAQLAAIGLPWRSLFLIGGLGPVLFVPLMLGINGRSLDRAPRHRADDISAEPVAPARAPSKTSKLAQFGVWGCFFSTLFILYLLLNWLPILLADLGLRPNQAAQGAALFNLGGLGGAVAFSVALRFVDPKLLLSLIYAGLILALTALASLKAGPFATLGAVLAAGMFVIGGQYTLYGIVGAQYAPNERARSVASAVAVGRLGAFLGPLFAGFMLQGGAGSVASVAGLIPLAAFAGVTALLMSSKQPCSHAA
ncbi:MAG: MFS transporter [Sphingomonadales bacterium]|nr:MFS transporter [Sphingomonadales bacterium]